MRPSISICALIATGMSGIGGCCDDLSSYEGLIVEFQPSLIGDRIEVQTVEAYGEVSLADPFHMCPKWCWRIFNGSGELLIGRPDESHLAFAQVDVDVIFPPSKLTLTVLDGETVVGMETFNVGTAEDHNCGGPGQRRVTMQLGDP